MTWQKHLSFLRPKMCNIKTAASFMVALKKNILLHLETQIHSNNYRLTMTHIIVHFVIATLFLLSQLTFFKSLLIF